MVGAGKFSAEKAGIFQTPATMAAMVANVPLSLSPAVLRLLHWLEAEQTADWIWNTWNISILV